MSNVIHLLPESVANLIHAGEVIQRPASVVKELVENSIDAGAENIKIVIRDAGRTLIQVIDDGCGMTETDARLAFEQHATSKINQAADLYSIHTMGFRGEALASIAAVAQVELLTRRPEDELGVKIEIAGSKIQSQEPANVAVGSQFCVKNLFFNTPGRRNFMKSDNVEMKHITAEFLRVALAHPSVGMTLTSNGVTLYALPKGNMKQRVSAVAGKALSQDLLPIDVETNIATIKGFIGTPETARKTSTEQYFFANNRYMRSPYFHKAVVDAYKNIIAPDLTPSYFVYIDVDPQSIDVNVHPQKTEIKFSEDTAVWQLLNASVRDCLGKYNILPSLDFDTAKPIDIPTYVPNRSISSIPNISAPSDVAYNPFEHETNSWDTRSESPKHSSSETSYEPRHKQSVDNWETLYESRMGKAEQQTIFTPSEACPQVTNNNFFQFRNRFIVTPVKSGMMFIDQHRAHERIEYDSISRMVSIGSNPSQRLIFPESMPMSREDACIVEEISTELDKIGFELAYDESKGMLNISAIPSQITANEATNLIVTIIEDMNNGEADVCASLQELVVKELASKGAIPNGKTLSIDEMSSIYDKLFSSESPSISPHGKTIFRIISNDDIDGLF